MKLESEEYLKTIICGLVDYPEQVVVEKSHDEMGILLSVSVHEHDMGKVIGRAGQTAKAIRQIVNTFGFKQQEKVSMRILEPLQA